MRAGRPPRAPSRKSLRPANICFRNSALAIPAAAGVFPSPKKAAISAATPASREGSPLQRRKSSASVGSLPRIPSMTSRKGPKVRSGLHVTRMSIAPPCRRANSESRRDFPTPGSPSRLTTCATPLSAPAHRASSIARASSRPTSGLSRPRTGSLVAMTL